MTVIRMSLFLIALLCMPLRADEGLVLHYDFQEGAGSVVQDRSGQGVNGTIKGQVEWVKTPGGGALRLNGDDTYIDCGPASSFGSSNRGTALMWVNLEAYQGGLLARSTGMSNPDLRLVIAFQTYYGGDQLAWDMADGVTVEASRIQPPPALNRWSLFALTFDDREVRAYVDGKLVHTSAKGMVPIVEGVPLRIGWCEGLGISCMKGLLGEVRLYDRVLTHAEVLSLFKARASVLGADTSWLENIGLKVTPVENSRHLYVQADVRGLWPIPTGSKLNLEAKSAGSARSVKKTVELPTSSGDANSWIDLSGFPEGSHMITATVRDAKGTVVGNPASASFLLSKPSGLAVLPPGTKRLNNMVVELLNVKPGQSTHTFNNPYDGWVFFSVTGADALTVDGLQVPLSATIPSEAMRYLEAGKHTARIGGQTGKTAPTLVIRAVPEMIYGDYPGNPIVSGYGKYDWEFLSKHVWPNTNCMVTYDSVTASHEKELMEWKASGKRILFHGYVPGMGSWVPPLEKAFEYWNGLEGFRHPLADGPIIDEFYGGTNEPKYLALTEALDRVYQDASMRDRVFYAFVASHGVRPLYDGKTSLLFTRAVMRHGGKFALEYYYPDLSTEDMVMDAFSSLREEMIGWQEFDRGSLRSQVIAFGYMSQPRESQNRDATADFKVLMDMEMNLCANDPAFVGLYGIHYYKSAYCDEENVRWASRLFRHYCIEGKRNMLSDEYGFKYKLDHLRNPDFNEGLSGWEVSSAEEGGITTGRMSGWGFLQGRYPQSSDGDRFLITRRSSKGANSFSQVVRNLKPGSLYSLKMYTADHGNITGGISDKNTPAVSIRIDGVEMLEERCFDQVIDSIHYIGKFNDENKPWLNYHWRVFRAKAPTAGLTVSDWSGDGPGGEIGQEIMYNFVEIQPYFLD